MPQTGQEKKLINFQQGLEGLGIAYGSIYFVFFSNLGDSLKNIFASLSSYFQTAGFILNGILLILNTIAFVLAPNKNAGKVGNLFLGVLQLTLLGLATFGVVVFGTTAATILIGGSITIDILIHLVKSIYCAIRSIIAMDTGQKIFYKNEALDASIKLIVTGIAVIIIILAIMAPPFLGLTVVATLSMGMGVFLAAVGIAAIASAVYKTYKSYKASVENPEQNVAVKSIEQAAVENSTKVEDKLPAPTLDTSLEKPSELVNEQAISELPKPNFLSFFWHYYDHSTIKSDPSPNDISKAINTQMYQLKKEILHNSAVTEEQENKSLPVEEEKRKDKITALYVLKKFVEHIEKKEISASGGLLCINFDDEDELEMDNSDENDIKIAFLELKYSNPLDLKEQFNDWIVQQYPGVFQSFFYDVGKTQQLFAQAYQLLEDSRYINSEPIAQLAEDSKESIPPYTAPK